MTAAVAKIAGVFASPHEPNAAAILPGSMAASVDIDVSGAMVVIIRLEGIDVSVTDRALHLLAADPSGAEIDENSSSALWQRIRDVELLVNQPGDVWKLSCAPAAAPNIIAAIQDQFDITFLLIGLEVFYGWLVHPVPPLVRRCGQHWRIMAAVTLS